MAGNPLKPVLDGHAGQNGNRIRLVHLCTRLPIGGMEHVVVGLFDNLPEHKFDSAVWCLEEGDFLGRELLAAGRPVQEFHRRRRRDPMLFLRLARRLRADNVEILHCHDELSWFYGTVAARLARRDTRVIVTMHGRRLNIASRHLYEQRLLAAKSASIVAVSDFLRQQLLRELRLDADRVTTIKNGIAIAARYPSAQERRDARARLGLPDGAIVAGTVGELSAIKNLDLTLDAVAAARRGITGLRLVFIGDGRLRAHLEQRAANLGLRDVVLFAGIRRDVDAVLPAFDVYLCSSDYEGVSLSILEAMARGRPVIATAVGGNPELIQAEETGLLVPKGDAAGMANAITRLACDPQLRERFGRRAQTWVRDTFSMERMIRDYERAYAAALRGSAAGARLVALLPTSGPEN
jgi:glycosyltransferase involved in cell wall biosynthesis